MKGNRVILGESGFAADANVQPRHPADAAAWVWHPACGLGETAFLRFTLTLTLAAAEELRVHVSADQRFQLRVDGAVIGYGPDRGEITAWPVASYDLTLAAGRHQFEALVWWINDETLPGLRADAGIGGTTARVRPPVAQASWRGGFLLAGEGAWTTQLNTGRAAWHVKDLTAAVQLVQPAFYAYHDIGPEFHVDAAKWKLAAATGGNGVAAEVIAGPIPGNPHGVQRPGWRLRAATLPEQLRERARSGVVRALSAACTDGPFEENPATLGGAETSAWTELFRGRGEVVVPAHSARTVLWDFQDYVCGYGQLATRGGRGAQVRVEWAEALHAAANRAAVTKATPKGRRDEIAGKIMAGFGDEFFPDGGAAQFPAFWWRSGRYVRVQVRTQAEPLVLVSLEILATGYPLGEAARFHSDDEALNAVAVLAEKTVRGCAHEGWADCPYYEQMAYVGDSRLAALNNYALFADDRLSRRMLELFDDSRANHGLVAERAPGSWAQVSVTYSLLWVLMVRDFAWWRADAGFVRARLRGVRAMLDEVLALTQADQLLHAVPGWPFVDWVPAWNEGCGPGVREGDSSIVNLHLLLALRAHAELENAFGEPELAARASRRAAALEAAILHRYWSDERGLLADTPARDAFSEHAQALGLLAGLRAPGGAAQWADHWLAADDLARATIYFSFYIMDALRVAGRAAALHERFQLWRDVRATGLLTLPEAPEPTRSDCHGWSGHVRWHFAASVAGVRPAGPGFAQVEIAPLLGGLRELDADVRHPRGVVKVSLRRPADGLQGTIDLPAGVEGTLRWGGHLHALHAGRNVIALS